MRKIKVFIAWPLFILAAVLIWASMAHCQERTKREIFLSPFWNTSDPLAYNLTKLGGYATGALDAALTSQAQARAIAKGGRVIELNTLDRAFGIDPYRPETVKRQLSSFAIQYGFTLLIDWGYHKTKPGSWDRKVMAGLRMGLSGYSVYGAKKAYGNGRW